MAVAASHLRAGARRRRKSHEAAEATPGNAGAAAAGALREGNRAAWSPCSLQTPVDNSTLVLLRLVVSGCILVDAVRYLAQGTYTEYYIDDPFHFKFFGFSWVRRLPPTGMRLVFMFLPLSALAVFVGFQHRCAATLLFATHTYLFLLDASVYRNHTYLFCLLTFLMIFAPMGEACSVDAMRVPSRASSTCPRWCVLVFRLQLGCVYFYAGVAKLDPGWLSGATMLDVLQNPRPGAEFLDERLRTLCQQPLLLRALVWGGLVYDLLIPFVMLSLRRSAPLRGFLLGASLHAGNIIIFGTSGLGTFPWFMLLANVIFLDPRAVRFRDHPPRHETRGRRHTSRWVMVLMLVHCTAQLLLPLRPHLYPGYTSWTREGHLWSWRMMLNVRRIETFELFTRHPGTGARKTLAAFSVLAGRQRAMVAYSPDLLLQFARDIHSTLHTNTGTRFPVFANITQSINGMAARPFVDPGCDLARVEWSFAPKTWILAPPPFPPLLGPFLWPT